jgi:hypothetical protein
MYIELSKDNLLIAIKEYLSSRVKGDVSVIVYEEYDDLKEKQTFCFDINVKDSNEK